MSAPLLLLLLTQIVPPPSDVGVGIRHAGGQPVAGGWQAYVAEIDNRAATEREVEIQLRDEYTEAAARRRERVAPGTRKRVFLYLRLPERTVTCDVRHRILVGSEKDSPWSLSSQLRWDPNATRLGLLSPDPAQADAFGLPLAGTPPLAVARLTAESFPDRRLGLDGYDAILAHDVAWDAFSIDQARALAEYVRHGGRLILSPGPRSGVLAHPVLKSFVSIETRALEEVRTLPGLATYGAFRGSDPFQVHPILNGEPGRGESRRFPVGLGHVLVLPYDVRRAPFDAWPGMRRLWRELLPSGRSAPFTAAAMELLPGGTTGGRLELANTMGDLINPYPSFALLALVCGVFILILGPLNYGVLRSRGAPLLAVATLPLLSFLLLGILLAAGTAIKGVSTVLLSVRLIHARPGEPWAREIPIVTLFSPSSRSYDLTPAPGGDLRPLGREDGRHLDASLDVETGAALTLRGVVFDQYQTLHFQGDGLRDLGRGIRFDVDAATGRVNVDNGSAIALSSCVVVDLSKLSIHAVGPVAAGASAASTPGAPQKLPFLAEAIGAPPQGLAAAVLRSYGIHSLRSEALRYVLIALAPDPIPPATVNAPLSGRSQSLLLLAVPEGAR